MNQVALEREERQRARYTINTVLARIKLAAQTLDSKQMNAPHRFILMDKTVLDALEQSAGALPFTDSEAMRGNLIVYCKIYCGYPVVTDADLDNPEIFQTISDIMVMDCSLTAMYRSRCIPATICSGHNIIEVSFDSTDNPIGPDETVRSPHYYCSNFSYLNTDWYSYVDFEKYSLIKECKDFIDYQSTIGAVSNIPANKVSQCRSCGVMFALFQNTLSLETLKSIYEKHHGEIASG